MHLLYCKFFILYHTEKANVTHITKIFYIKYMDKFTLGIYNKVKGGEVMDNGVRF